MDVQALYKNSCNLAVVLLSVTTLGYINNGPKKLHCYERILTYIETAENENLTEVYSAGLSTTCEMIALIIGR